MRKSFWIRTGMAAMTMSMLMGAVAMADGEENANTSTAGQYSLDAGSVEAENTANVSGTLSLAGVSVSLDDYYSTLESGSYSRVIEMELGAATDEEIARKASVLDEYENLGIALVDNYLNVRELPSSENTSQIIGKMIHDTACEILDYADGWYKVKSGPVTGYVSADYIITGDEAVAVALEEAKLRAIVKTDGGELNVRKEPSTDSEILEKVSAEERYEVTEVLDGWVKIVTLTGEEGYVSSDYVEVKYALNEAVEFTPPMTSSKRLAIIEYAQQFLGNPYVFGGTSLTRGTDCSGFVMRVFENFGISLSRTSKAQANNGTEISYSEAQPGDLIFYGRSGVSGIGHVGIYLGNGKIIHAASSRTGIIISNAKFTSILKVVNVID